VKILVKKSLQQKSLAEKNSSELQKLERKKNSFCSSWCEKVSWVVSRKIGNTSPDRHCMRGFKMQKK
jgi:hypothetical protein